MIQDGHRGGLPIQQNPESSSRVSGSRIIMSVYKFLQIPSRALVLQNKHLTTPQSCSVFVRDNIFQETQWLGEQPNCKAQYCSLSVCLSLSLILQNKVLRLTRRTAKRNPDQGNFVQSSYSSMRVTTLPFWKSLLPPIVLYLTKFSLACIKHRHLPLAMQQQRPQNAWNPSTLGNQQPENPPQPTVSSINTSLEKDSSTSSNTQHATTEANDAIKRWMSDKDDPWSSCNSRNA